MAEFSKASGFTVNRRTILKGSAVAAGALAMPSLAFAQASDGGPVVQTTYGPIRGAMSQSNSDVFTFKGVPYGADTGGKNRFMPPQPPTPWTDTLDTTAYGPRFPQGPFPPAPFMQEEGEDLDQGPMSENALVLNVWTAGLDDAKRPVMVFHHGGGFSSGSGGSFRYDGTNLAAKHGVVLVTTNHRLNVFGYLNLSQVFPDQFGDVANVGMLDIVQSLQWIRDNIAQFGGDPDNVTVFGQSGGGSKVTTLMGMPAAQGLFEKAIAESGFATSAATADAAAAGAQAFVDALGASSVEDLQNASIDDIMAAAGMVRGIGSPWVDGAVLPAVPFPVSQPNATGPDVSADVPLMVGWVQTETTFFNGPMDEVSDADLPMAVMMALNTQDQALTQQVIDAYKQAYPDAPNNELVLSIQADAGTGNTALQVAALKAAQDAAPAFVYHFEGMTEVRNLMAPHTIEIAYVFDNLELSQHTNGEVTPEKQMLADMVSGAWTNFAKNGQPSAAGLPDWPPYTADMPAVMVLDNMPEVVMGPPEVLALNEARSQIAAQQPASGGNGG